LKKINIEFGNSFYFFQKCMGKTINRFVEAVAIQNFVRLGITVDISNYEIYNCRNELFEYLAIIALVEIGVSCPLRFWEIWELRKSKVNLGNTAVEMLCKSNKCNCLIPLLKEYYFKNSHAIPTKDQLIALLVEKTLDSGSDIEVLFLKTVEKAFKDFDHNEALKVALMGHIKLALLKNSFHKNRLYLSMRKPPSWIFQIYPSNDETLLTETCVLWMHIQDNNLKKVILSNSLQITKMISSDISSDSYHSQKRYEFCNRKCTECYTKNSEA
jgi:hypothetical protein